MSKNKKIISITISLILVLTTAVIATYFQIQKNAKRNEEILIATTINDFTDDATIDILGTLVTPKNVAGTHTFPITKTVSYNKSFEENTQTPPIVFSDFLELKESLKNLGEAEVMLSSQDYSATTSIEEFTTSPIHYITTEYTLTISRQMTQVVLSENDSEQLGEISGDITYEFLLQYVPPMTITLDKNSYLQGELIVVKATGFDLAEIDTNLMHGVNFYIEGNEEGLIYDSDDGIYTAFVPVDVTQAIGEYYIELARGEESVTAHFSVHPREFEVQYLTVDSTVAANSVGNAEEVERYSNTFEEVILTTEEVLYATEPFIAPVSGYITTEFATQRYDLGRTTPRWHNAIDIGGNAIGTSIAASNAGKIIMSDFFANTGNTIMIDHGFGLKTIYMHLDTRYVEVGDIVEIGESIGTIGNTGYSTGAHLHYGVLANGVYVNPLYDYK